MIPWYLFPFSYILSDFVISVSLSFFKYYFLIYFLFTFLYRLLSCSYFRLHCVLHSLFLFFVSLFPLNLLHFSLFSSFYIDHRIGCARESFAWHRKLWQNENINLKTQDLSKYPRRIDTFIWMCKKDDCLVLVKIRHMGHLTAA